MMQARTGLILGMVLLLVPAVAAAQGKGAAAAAAPDTGDTIDMDADEPLQEGT